MGNFWSGWSQAASWLAGLALMAVSGCMPQHHNAGPAYVPSPHYVVGNPYQAGGTWYYPAENLALDVTGIAAVQTPRDGLTADGELRDPSALTAAMQTVQLPMIVSVTNLENGHQIELRVNDRGPATPSRVIEISPRAATYLGIPPGGAAPVRVQIDETLSRRLADQLGGGDKLTIQAAPTAVVAAQDLPPPGATQPGRSYTIGAAKPQQEEARVPDRLPEIWHITHVSPTQIFIAAGSFGRFDYANRIAARLSGLGSNVLRSRTGRDTQFTVQCGPFATIAKADAALAFALRAGVVDARIVIE